jgi:hypothetical protein
LGLRVGTRLGQQIILQKIVDCGCR